MFKRILKVLKANYKLYLALGLAGFILTLILESCINTNHIFISSVLFPFAHFCGCLYVDTKKDIYTDIDTDATSASTMDLLSVFLATFLIVTFILEIGFKYEYTIIRIVIPFFSVILVDKLSYIKQTKTNS